MSLLMFQVKVLFKGVSNWNNSGFNMRGLDLRDEKTDNLQEAGGKKLPIQGSKTKVIMIITLFNNNVN
jgi:hypothetical protein